MQREIKGLATSNSWDKGVAYAKAGRVTSFEVDPIVDRVSGTCQGSRGMIYAVQVNCHFDAHGFVQSIQGICDCPVGFNCKHCVAVVLVGFGLLDNNDSDIEHVIGSLPPDFAPEAAPTVPDWKRKLSQVFDIEPGNAHIEKMLGLEFDFSASEEVTQKASRFGVRPAGSFFTANIPAQLDVRIVTPGKKKKWVRTGLSWAAIRNGTATGYDHRVIRELERLCLLFERISYNAPGANIPISLKGLDGGPLWEILRELVSNGVPMIEEGTGRPIQIEPSPANADIDIVRDGNGALNILSKIEHPTLGPDQRFEVFGEPAHTVAWRDKNGLHLAPFSKRVPSSWKALLKEAAGIRIPAEDVDEFLAESFPTIARTNWLSSDGSFVPPAPPAPHLCLAITDAHADDVMPRIKLGWSWRYRDELGVGYGPLRLEAFPGEHGRDLPAEGDVLALVIPILQKFHGALTNDGKVASESEISGLDAVNFITDGTTELEALGIEIESVVLPEYRQSETLEITLDVNDDVGSKDWLDLTVAVNVDGHEVPLANLIEALARGEDALFVPEGIYVRLDNPELESLRNLLEEARNLTDGRSVNIKVSENRLSWWEEILSLGIVQTASSRWLDKVRKSINREPIEVPIPTTLHAELRDYQLTGFQWLANLRRDGLGGILADDMGLGKTVQTLAMVADEREEHTSGKRPWLVVAPTSVVPNWAAEAARFTPDLHAVVIEATGARRSKTLSEISESADIVITSFALLRLESEEYAKLSWAGLIIDEAQNAKNHASKVFAALIEVGAPVTYAVTGTPMENNLGELWSMLTLTAPGLLGSPKQFQQTYRKPIESGGKTGADMMALLRRRIAPFLLRRTKTGVAIDLPPKQEQLLYVNLSAAHRKLYDQHLQRERQRVLGLLEDADHNQIEILAALTRLRQLAIDPSLIHDATSAKSSKTETLLPLLTEAAAEGHRVLVFSQFTRYLKRIASELEKGKIEYSYLDGTTPRRQEVLQDFARGNAPVFLMSLKAGGVGINLTEADYAVLTDPWWNPAVESQAIARTHRIGQTRPVLVYRIVARDTIEEKMLALQQSKKELADALLAEDQSDNDSGKHRQSGGARLSAEDIQMLLS